MIKGETFAPNILGGEKNLLSPTLGAWLKLQPQHPFTQTDDNEKITTHELSKGER